MEQLKAAVIGLGRMGAEPSGRLQGKIPPGWLPISHAEAIQSVPELRLVALCDTDQEKLAALSGQYGVAGFREYQQLLEEVQPDFLCIATRTEGRAEIIRSACESGVRIIYFEKPAARSIAACKAALDSADARGVTLGYGVNRRYHACYRKAKEMVVSGVVGELQEIIIEHGNSTLYWTHPHSADLILFFSGSTELDYIQGTCSFANGYEPASQAYIDNDPVVVNAFYQFRNGIRAIITGGNGWNTRLVCSKGIITVCSDGSWIEIHEMSATGYLKKAEIVQVAAVKSATITAFEEMVKYSETRKELPITPAEILCGMIMLNGLVYSSLNSGRRVSPVEVPAEMIITGKSGSFYA